MAADTADRWAPATVRARVAGLALLLAAIAFGTWARIDTALRDPNFDVHRAEGMLKSDPALLYYFVERILDAGGLPPDDFRADPRVRFPLETDIPATFPVGQEFFVAWTYRLFGGELPLHVFCVVAMALWASLCAIGVYGLALEVGGRPLCAGLAAALFAVCPVNYRTIGFILVGEDFSLPWLALHFYLAARAIRLGTPVSALLAGASLITAAATWHASPFFLALEAACVCAWFLRTGQNPFERAVGWVFPATVLAGSIAVPVLHATGFALSPPMLAVLGLCAAALWRRTDPQRTHRTSVAVAAGTWIAVLGLSVASSRLLGGGLSESSHVFGLLWAKIRHLGHRPEDPLELPFEVRLMWQGPFETLDLARWRSEIAIFAVALVAIAVAIWTIRILLRPGAPAAEGCILLLAALSLPIAWLIERTQVLPGILIPVVAAVAATRWRRGPAALGLAVAVQAVLFASFLRDHRIGWYAPPQRQEEIARMVECVADRVPEGEAVAADFMNSTAILCHTFRPILLQPKYEDRVSRDRAAEFLLTFFHGTPEDFRRFLTTRYGCRYVLFDRVTLWSLCRYAAGLKRDRTDPDPGTAAAAFLSQDAATLAGVPGYRLLYRSPSEIRQSNGSPSDFFRLYELAIDQ